MTNPRPNPYPGPRSFQKGEKLYGRQRETWELLNLLIAERIVLLASPSGAGKTSLVQAALAPELEAEGFRVLPVMRPGLLPDQPVPGANRYLLSLLLGLEGGRPEEEQLPLAELAGLSLSAYLETVWRIPADAGWHGDVLLFDQFEEVLTIDPSDREAKTAFFEQVGEALRDRNRWALFSIREEFVAALDPYLRPIPARFDKGRRYLLDLLGPDAAREAMQGPAADQEPPTVFTEAAARQLADDLRRVQVQQPDGTTEATLGPFVEPVQLQVVCRRLWDHLAADDFSIGLDDLEAVGDVDTALAGYYADIVAKVANSTDTPEETVRKWIDRKLITEAGVRSQVLLEADSSQGLANAAIWSLVSAHLVRAEQRRGATWFELAHDRLIAPIRQSNQRWFASSISSVTKGALAWEQAGKPFARELITVGNLTEQTAKGCTGEWVLVFHPKLAKQLLRPIGEVDWLRQSDLQIAESTLMQQPDEYNVLERDYILASRGAAYYRRRLNNGIRALIFPMLVIVFLCGVIGRLPTLPTVKEKDKEISLLQLALSTEELNAGRLLARAGRIDMAIEKYRQAANRRVEVLKKTGEEPDTQLIDDESLNILCRYGSLWGEAYTVSEFCNQAVAAALDPVFMTTFEGQPLEREVDARDSRGLARALTGDVQGSIADFEFTLAQGGSADFIASRTAWVEALRAGTDPALIFDEATLADLRE